MQAQLTTQAAAGQWREPVDIYPAGYPAELKITRANTYVDPAVTASWARGEWAGNDDASWFRELAQMRGSR